MENKTYFFRPDNKVLKQGFFMTDAEGNTVYESKVLKQSLIGPAKVEFINHVSGKTEEHQVGKVGTTEVSGALTEFFSVKSSFKFDGKRIWDYLHGMGVRIDSAMSGGRLGMTYTVSLRGEQIATLSSASPKGGKALITSPYHYDVTTSEEYLDLAFLTVYSIARTDQTFYD